MYMYTSRWNVKTHVHIYQIVIHVHECIYCAPHHRLLEFLELLFTRNPAPLTLYGLRVCTLRLA